MQVNEAVISDSLIIGGGKSQAFTIGQSGHAFHILSDALYSDKKLAVVREVACNAADAHIVAGVDSPIEIVIDRSQLSIQDYGPGIPHERIAEIYATYFGSTKTNDGTQTGGFGLGSKAPFAYTDNFTVENSYGGKRVIYAAHLAEEGPNAGTPVIQEIVSVPTEATGVKVIVPLKDPEDHVDFTSIADKVCRTGGIKATLNGKLVETFDMARLKAEGLMTETRYGTRKTVRVVYGNVAYNLDNAPAEISDRVDTLLRLLPLYQSIAIYIPPNAVSVTPSRESLAYDGRTIGAVMLAVQKVIDGVTSNIDRFSSRRLNEMTQAYKAKYPNAFRFATHLMTDLRDALATSIGVPDEEEEEDENAIGYGLGEALEIVFRSRAKEHVSRALQYPTNSEYQWVVRVLERVSGMRLRPRPGEILSFGTGGYNNNWRSEATWVNVLDRKIRRQLVRFEEKAGTGSLNRRTIWARRSWYDATRLKRIGDVFLSESRSLKLLVGPGRYDTTIGTNEMMITSPDLTEAMIEKIKIEAARFGFGFRKIERPAVTAPVVEPKKLKRLERDDVWLETGEVTMRECRPSAVFYCVDPRRAKYHSFAEEKPDAWLYVSATRLRSDPIIMADGTKSLTFPLIRQEAKNFIDEAFHRLLKSCGIRVATVFNDKEIAFVESKDVPSLETYVETELRAALGKYPAKIRNEVFKRVRHAARLFGWSGIRWSATHYKCVQRAKYHAKNDPARFGAIIYKDKIKIPDLERLMGLYALLEHLCDIVRGEHGNKMRRIRSVLFEEFDLKESFSVSDMDEYVKKTEIFGNTNDPLIDAALQVIDRIAGSGSIMSPEYERAWQLIEIIKRQNRAKRAKSAKSSPTPQTAPLNEAA